MCLQSTEPNGSWVAIVCSPSHHSHSLIFSSHIYVPAHSRHRAIPILFILLRLPASVTRRRAHRRVLTPLDFRSSLARLGVVALNSDRPGSRDPGRSLLCGQCSSSPNRLPTPTRPERVDSTSELEEMSTSAAAPRRAGPGLYPTDTPVVARTTPLASAADGQTSQIIRSVRPTRLLQSTERTASDSVWTRGVGELAVREAAGAHLDHPPS